MNYLLLETNKILCFDMLQETHNWNKQLYIDNGSNSYQLVHKFLTQGGEHLAGRWWYHSRSAYFDKNGYKVLVSVYDLHSEVWEYYS